MLGKAVASGCQLAKSEGRRLKQLPRLAAQYRSAIQVRAPSSPPANTTIYRCTVSESL
jgi:hypothetical protein